MQSSSYRQPANRSEDGLPAYRERRRALADQLARDVLGACKLYDAKRAVRDRHWKPGEVARREAAQLPLEEKRARADAVIDNSVPEQPGTGGSDADGALEARVDEVLRELGVL